jgi:hypothetical protein
MKQTTMLVEKLKQNTQQKRKGDLISFKQL